MNITELIQDSLEKNSRIERLQENVDFPPTIGMPNFERAKEELRIAKEEATRANSILQGFIDGAFRVGGEYLDR